MFKRNIFFLLIILLSCFADAKGQPNSTPSHDAELRKAVENAVSYFTKQEEEDISTMYNYHFLQKKFAIKELYPSKVIFEKLNKYGDMFIFHNVELYRLVDKNFSIPYNRLKDGFNNSMSEMILKALYCDVYPLTKDFLKIIRNESAAGGYNLTHALLALQWIRENGCLDSGELKALEATIIEKHIELINSASEFDDLTIEAVAFVQYAGFKHLIKKEWIDKIIAAQQTDGGWKWNSASSNTDSHPSIVALWSLLEWMHQDKTTSWITK